MKAKPKTLWRPVGPAVQYLRGKVLIRRNHKSSRGGGVWSRFYDAETNELVCECNGVFADYHFAKVKQ